MRSPLPAMVVIVCPHCGTRYQVPAETLGPRGREVQCAHCSKSWPAAPGAGEHVRDPDQIFDETAERDLDAAFAEEEKAAVAAAMPEPTAEEAVRPVEEIRAALAPETKTEDPKAKTRRDKAFARRQISRTAKLPLARIRRAARLVALGLLLTLLVAGVAFRTEIVRSFPALAGVYAALGMNVNIVGLEFRDTHTLMTLRSDANVLKLDARIYSVASRPVIVPPVVVTLLDESGTALYEWSVTPETRDLEPGEVVDFTTQLTSPPPGATRVRLTFSGGRAQSETPIAATIQPQEPAH
jgi:predicted Zn finger-like uncharacterized protein